MTVEEKFYLLLMDEIRVQPGLVDELSFDLEHYAERFAGCPLDHALIHLDQMKLSKGDGFQALGQLGPQPIPLARPLDQLHAGMSEDKQSDYETLCRGALLNLLWRDFIRAEEKINLAKFLKDDWAFAHFLYGLLRGIDGDLGKAHFELYLAINREPFVCAKQRIDRALSLVR